MILVMKQNTDQQAIDNLGAHLRKVYGVQTSPIVGTGTTIIGLVGDTSAIPVEQLEQMEYVERVVKVQEPYKRSNRKFHPDDTIIEVDDVRIGGKAVVLAAGPCSVESEAQITELASRLQRAGARMLRGGAYKPRSSPYAFQGLKAEGLLFLKHAREKTGLPVISEITNPAQMELFREYVDVIQVGTRNMQNFELLKEIGRSDRPVLLKRGFANTLDELLMSAEYIMNSGNPNVVLCERGIRTFEPSTRNTLDISAVPYLKARSHLPVFVDPSHASGASWLVPALSMAAVACGCDGLLIEVHQDPPNAWSDGPQSLTPEAFSELVERLATLSAAIGRSLA